MYSFPVILAKLTKGLVSRIQKAAKSYISPEKSSIFKFFT